MHVCILLKKSYLRTGHNAIIHPPKSRKKCRYGRRLCYAYYTHIPSGPQSRFIQSASPIRESLLLHLH